MIITERAVFLNFPKTGSSFIRAALKQATGYNRPTYRLLRSLRLPHKPPMVELLLPSIDRQHPAGLSDPHGTYRQIPLEHRDKVIVAAIRNPFHRYVSTYRFGWWARHPHANPEVLREAYPAFPDLTFGEYMDMLHRFGRPNRLGELSPTIELGFMTIQFIQLFFRDPDRVLRCMDHAYIEQRAYLDDMPDIVFLHQENLNQELYQCLVDLGYPEDQVRFILNAARVNVTPGPTEANRLEDLYTPELVARILERDRLLFDRFPEYQPPVLPSDR